MSNPFVKGKRPQNKTINQMLNWLDELGLSVYGSMTHEDGSVTGLHDFNAEMIVELRNNLENLSDDEDDEDDQ